MFTAKEISTDHKDLIHDVSYDFYGRRMATCSSDQSVKVMDLKDGEWQCTATWRCHSGSVWRVTWAHPEFGQVLATCSFDRTVAIWEEQVEKKEVQGTETHVWVKRASLVDSRMEVNDVKFAPHHLGLMIATCSTDGMLRIYEAQDVMNLSQWSLTHNLSCKPGSSCLSWNPSKVHPPMIVVGTDDTGAVSSGRIQIFEYSEEARKWQNLQNIVGVAFDPVHDVAFAPNIGRSYHMLAVASSKDINIIQLVPTGSDAHGGHTKLDIRNPAHLDHAAGEGVAGSGGGTGGGGGGAGSGGGAQVWRLAWNVTGTVLASSGDDGRVCLWKANYLDNWKLVSVLKPSVDHMTPFQQAGTAHRDRPQANWMKELVDF